VWNLTSQKSSSTEELSREELGESSHVSSEADENHEDLGESSEVAAKKTDSLGVALARMSSQFEGIESTTKKAATEETEMEHDSVKAKKEKKKRAEMKAHKQEMAQKAAQKKKLTKQLASKKQSALEQKLAKEEATLRATTATKVKAQMSLQNAVNAERKHQLKMAKNKNPITGMTPEMITREEYKRMYIQNTEQQALQQKADLDNRLAAIKGDDARHMKVLVDDIARKRKVLKTDIKTVASLSSKYREDHELGEGLGEKAGAEEMTNAVTKLEATNVGTESDIIAQAGSLINELKVSSHSSSMAPVLDAAQRVSADQYMENDLGESASSSMQAPPLASEKQMHVAAELAAAITGLHLKTAQLKAMHKQDEAVLTEARQLRSASLNARSMEQVAQGRTVNMKSLVQGLGHHIERSEEDMQLTQTLFAREEDTSRDLGESSDVATKKQLPPVQAELNYEQDAMEKAEASLRHLAKIGPKLEKEQMATDKTQFAKALKTQNAKLDALHKHFVQTAADLSPNIKSQQALDDAVRKEQDRNDQYVRDLKAVRVQAGSVRVKEKDAHDALEGVH